jgi:hypothetical protein
MYQCPICRRAATNNSPPDFDGISVKCLECDDYEISGTAVDELMRLELAGRLDALQKAKRFALPGTKPSITTICL